MQSCFPFSGKSGSGIPRVRVHSTMSRVTFKLDSFQDHVPYERTVLDTFDARLSIYSFHKLYHYLVKYPQSTILVPLQNSDEHRSFGGGVRRRSRNDFARVLPSELHNRTPRFPILCYRSIATRRIRAGGVGVCAARSRRPGYILIHGTLAGTKVAEK